MGRFTVGWCILAVFASANAFFPLIPEGKEVIYHYHGLMKAGTHLPTDYASSFVLDGLLHVQTDKNSTSLHFSDLKYKMQNGRYDYWHEFEAKEIPLVGELRDVFEHPFKVVYEPCGHALGIVVQGDEPQYSVNFKRAVASMMQMYTEKLEWDKQTPYAFHANEHTLYGKGPAYYTVFPEGDHWNVEKMFEPHTNYHMYAHLSTNSKMATCDVKYHQPLTRDSLQVYKIVKHDGGHMLDSLESNGGMYYTPNAGEGNAFHIYMNQTFHLKKIEDKATPMTIKSEKFYNGLTYYAADFNTMEGVADILHGRRTYDMDKMLVELEEMLYDTVKYINEYHLDMKEPDWKRGQLINRMLILMIQLDEKHLESMLTKLMGKTGEEDKDALHVYYHMLPMLGSHASYMYMMKLMKTKKVKDKLALEWLHDMPFSVKEPTKMLLEHMSEMLNWGDEISMDVRKAAILCFGTFVEKAMSRHGKVNHINIWTGHEGHDNTDNFTPDLELNDVFPGTKHNEKYIVMLGEKMKAAKDMGLRAVYISALHNTKMEKAIHYLWPIARGELWEDNYLRFLAITSMGSLVHHKDELIYEIFWPIMADHNLHTNIRVAAYTQIMQSHPSLQRLINMYWQMENEINPAFYQFHYSFMEEIIRTTDPCMEDFVTSVKQIMRYTGKPEYRGMTGVHFFDYMDTKFEYGHQFKTLLVHTQSESETTMKVRIGATIDNAKFSLYSFIFRVDGMEASLFDDVLLYMKEPNKLLNFEKVWKAYSNIYNNKNIRIDIGVAKYGQVVMSYHYDATNIKEFSQFLDFFVGDRFNYMKKYFSITYPMQTNLILPSEMGFPALFKIYIPKVYLFDFKITKEIVNKMITFSCDMHLKQWAHGRIGLSFYNPIIDAFQGVHRASSLDSVYPLYFDLSINPTQQSMKLSWKRHDDPQKDMWGMRSHAATFTFVRDDLENGKLKESSPESDYYALVTLGDKFKETRPLYDHDSSDTGYRHIVAKFDSDAYVHNLTIFKHFNYLHHIENCHTSIGHWFLMRFHGYTHAFIQPYPYTNGILIRSEASKQYPVTNVDMNLRITREYKRGDMLLLPGTKYNLRATYSVKNKEAKMKTWDANVIFDIDMGHTTSTMKAVLSRIIAGKGEMKICLDASRKFTTEHVVSEGTVALSKSTEPKCTPDEKIMEIKSIGEELEEQKDNKHLYGECYEQMWSDIHEMNSLACYMARDSFRKWTYDVKTFNLPTEFKHMMKKWFDILKMRYMNYFTKYDEGSMKLGKDSYKIVHEYPMIGDKTNLHIYTPESDYKFGGIPAWKYPLYKYHIMSTKHFTKSFKFMHMMGWTDICEIHPDVVRNSAGKDVGFVMPGEWTMYLGDAETNAKHGIWMKKISEHDAALKIVHNEQHSLEIIPIGHKMYEIMVDGKKLPEKTYTQESDWFWMDWVKETGVVSIVLTHIGGHLVYDGHHLLLEIPNLDLPANGHCAGNM